MDWNRVFFTADTHFNHGNILKYCKRPFLNDGELSMLADGVDFRVSRESVDLNDTTIIDNINAVVKRDDTLWHLGDFAFADYNTARKYRDRINCQNMYLIWGNHDKHDIRGLFTNCYDQYELRVDMQRLWLNHYPMLSWDGSYKGAWMLHGHVHGNIRKNPLVRAAYDQMLICDVGVDGPCLISQEAVYNHKFIPWSMPQLTKFMAPKIELNKANRTI